MSPTLRFETPHLTNYSEHGHKSNSKELNILQTINLTITRSHPKLYFRHNHEALKRPKTTLLTPLGERPPPTTPQTA